MHLIVCVEEKDGMSFCGRRLSSDRIVTQRIGQLASGKTLWMNAYSSRLFPNAKIRIDEAFFEKAGEGDYCFAETTQIPESIEKLESVILFCWNRRYPATQKFPRSILTGMNLTEQVEFAGYSHDKITMQRYR